MHRLGITMGNSAGGNTGSEDGDFEAKNLDRICRSFFEEPWFSEKLKFDHRVKLLKIWAASQCKTNRHDCELLGAMHQTLCIMGPELMIAWNNPYLIHADESTEELVFSLSQRNLSLPIDTCMSMIHYLVSSRDHFLATCSSPALQIQYNSLVENTAECVSRICKYLCFDPNNEALDSAYQFVRQRSDQKNDRRIN